jgi:hypothetical protein
MDTQFEFTVMRETPPLVAVINNETQQMERMIAAEENDLAPDGYYFKKIPIYHRWDYVNKTVVRDPKFAKRITMETI